MAIAVEEDCKTVTQLLRPWLVIFHNDNVTTWKFVIRMLTFYFGKTEAEAHRLTEEIDTTGAATVGAYQRELAELKQEQVQSEALRAGYPLKVTIEQN